MVGYVEASPEELKEHKEKYGEDWNKHAISRISADPEEAEQELRAYTCPCCGLVYEFSNDEDAQEKFDKKQTEHIGSCSRSFGNGYYEKYGENVDIETDMAFIDAESFLFTDNVKNLVKHLAKDADKEKVLELTKKICSIVEGESRANAFITLYNLLHSFTAKVGFYDNELVLDKK